MKAGIVLDEWKLPIFEKRLAAAGFTWSSGGNFTRGTIVLTVESDDPSRLAIVIRAANNEAAASRLNVT